MIHDQRQRYAALQPDRQRDLQRIDTIAIHRAGGGEWPPSVERLVDALIQYWPGGRIPYHMMVEANGRIVQLLDFGDVGAHARAYNVPAIGIAAIGDFRAHEPEPAQWYATVDAAVHVMLTLRRRLRVSGHVPGLGPKATTHGAPCPGACWPMDRFCVHVGDELERVAPDLIAQEGRA